LASKSLEEFASEGRKLPGAWIDTLPDELYNQVWDALNTDLPIGKIIITRWLHSEGYPDATQGKIAAILTRDRR
tara:strand:+ start:6817 stop:7038 length:222 start_codon:yes stop_codon:yes gene_type:complete